MKNYTDSPYIEKLFIRRGTTKNEISEKNENIFNFKSEIKDPSFTYEDILEKTKELENKKKIKEKKVDSKIRPKKMKKKSSSFEIKDKKCNFSNYNFKKFSLSKENLISGPK